MAHVPSPIPNNHSHLTKFFSVAQTFKKNIYRISFSTGFPILSAEVGLSGPEVRCHKLGSSRFKGVELTHFNQLNALGLPLERGPDLE